MRSCHGYLGQLQWLCITPQLLDGLVFCSNASYKPSHFSGTFVTASSWCHCCSDLHQDEPAQASVFFLIMWRNRLPVLQLWVSCWMQAVILSACYLPLGCFRYYITHCWVYFPSSLAPYSHSPGYKWENRLGMLVLCTCNPSILEITAKKIMSLSPAWALELEPISIFQCCTPTHTQRWENGGWNIQYTLFNVY